MKLSAYLKTGAAAAGLLLIANGAFAEDFNIPSGDLKTALETYTRQTGVSLVVSGEAIKGIHTRGVKGELSTDAALVRLLNGTGFTINRHTASAITIVPEMRSGDVQPLELAQATPARASVETVTVTSSKLGGADVQSIPIAITALSQEQLTATQTTGGPDLIKQVPNMTFTKTNFSGYSIQLRGIGTQAISVTTDPAVAVAFNDMPFIRNHFFEQEFYDVSQVEVLRGPQGTLYGRNATAGVVNLVSAKPTDQFEAMASADIGNYKNRRFEGMINLPIVDDRVDLRVAGEWTKRDGYSFNELTDSPIDGRDLWSARATLGLKLGENLKSYLVWEHYQENDDRMRSSKQLCNRDNGPSTVDGVATGQLGVAYLGQGCRPSSLYSAEAFGVPNALSLPYYGGLIGVGFGLAIGNPLIGGATGPSGDPYTSVTQSRDLRVIATTLNPVYKGKNDVFQLNTDYTVTPALTFTSQTGFNQDFLWSTEDYNRFNTVPGIFNYSAFGVPGGWGTLITPDGDFCDPQLGCSNRLVAQDLSEEHAWQLNQEFRLASSFSGPLNFSVGGNYLHYETEENYYVFINTFTMYAAKGSLGSPAAINWIPGVSDNLDCPGNDYHFPDPKVGGDPEGCKGYIDPNPIERVNNQGHNYFLSQNPYVLNSYAAFGEAYYQIFKDLKIIGGLRWTDDEKHFVDIPSEVFEPGYGYPITDIVNQNWHEWTGRITSNWTPKLDFTDQTLFYGSFSHGYKAGGANPPGAVLLTFAGGDIASPVHPLTFEPEFINAYELGTKNSLLDGALTFNGDVFFYDYKGYQISQIVDRTSINLNFDATIKGAELETTWEPSPGLKFGFTGGYQSTRMVNGSKAIDLIDRTAGNSGWLVVKPFVTQASNCVLPTYVVVYMLSHDTYSVPGACGRAYSSNLDPVTGKPYTSDLTGATDTRGDPISPGSYAGFDPATAPNGGAGFDKDLSGNELPNAPHFTTSFTAEYSVPVTQDWAATLHGDFYWQSSSWARVFNDDPYDRLHGYTNVNLALILTNQNGWQATGYVKNLFDATAITGTFLNSDDSGLTTNVFLTDPRLFGVRVTKSW